MESSPYYDHLHILSEEEIKQLYTRPVFDAEEQLLFFSMNESDLLAVEAFRGISSKIYFMLQLGHFKAKHLFFVFSFDQVQADVDYLFSRYFPGHQVGTLSSVSKPTRLNQQKLIRRMTGFRDCKVAAKSALLKKALQLAGIHSDPVFIFRSLLHYLELHKIILPAYSFIQRHIISQAISLEQQRLKNLLSKLLKSDTRYLLDQLLEPHPVRGVSFYL